MEAYNVVLKDKVTVIESKDKRIRMQVCKAGDRSIMPDTVLLEATLYKEKRSFIPDESYLFELVDAHDKPLTEWTDLPTFKGAIAFFFNSILDTELFIISIPLASALCPIERKGYNYHKIAG